MFRMTQKRLGYALALHAAVVSAACAGEETGATGDELRQGVKLGSPAQLDEGPALMLDWEPSTSAALTEYVVVEGRVFYDDQRDNGRFHERLSTTGISGHAGEGRGNLLAAARMTVEVLERDLAVSRPGSSCAPSEIIGVASVESDGTFRISVPRRDDCAHDEWSDLRLSIRVRTRSCDDGESCVSLGPRSFDVTDSSNREAYAMFHAYASPHSVGPSVDRWRTGDLIFGSRFDDTASPDVYAQAANYFATLVDTVSAVHDEAHIPFGYDRFGGVHVVFPYFSSGGGQTPNADTIHLGTIAGWPKGNLVNHEYGHIVHRRAQGGNYGGAEDPIQSWNAYSALDSFIAFKEGFANFIRYYATGQCESGWDDAELIAEDPDGRYYTNSVAHFLCDWVDSGAESALVSGSVYSDRVTDSPYSLWEALTQMESERPGVGADICDLLETPAVSEIAIATPGRGGNAVESLARLNHIACDR